jgi:phosphoribosylaminoimidazole carboxylase (NCAIR synthetase)
MNIIFIEPAFPTYQREFVRALHAIGATVIGIGERPQDHLDPELKSWLHHYHAIRSVTDEQALRQAVQQIQSQLWVDRLETTIEAHILPVAKVREACSIPGTTVRTAYLCRDKTAMKQVLREAGIPCAHSTAAASGAEVREFAAQVGYPLILKPRDAAGAAGTWRANNAAELEQAIRASGAADGASIAVEEFIEGHEGFYDTLSVNGHIAHDFISHYYPNVLEAMRTRWISPQIIATNRMDTPDYDELKAMGRRVNEVLGITSTATHMEWFFGPKGLKFSEIGCRPPGVCHWDVYCAGNEMDLYRDWALAVCHGRTEQRPSRRYASGIIALRPDRDGVIHGYDGTEIIWQRYADCIVADHFPAPGTPTQGVEAGYMANAWLRVRHPDYDELCRIMNEIGQTIKVRAG